MHDTTRKVHALKFLISLVLFSCSWLAMDTQSSAAVGDVNYISDVLTVPLRSGPSTSHRILHRGLPSGTQLTILAIDEEAGFTQVRTASGLEGWLTSQYLISTPIARARLATVQKQLQTLKAKMDKERKASENIQTAHKESDATNKTLKAQVKALSKELADLKIISADPIKEHTRNVELTEQNTRLAHEVEELSSKTKQLEENVQLKWLMYGGALVLIGLIFGLVLKKRPRPQTSYSSRY